MALLSVEEIEVHFGGVKALSEVSFDLGEGEILGLIGPNGAGKTTLFNVITGFVRPRAGAVRFAGEPITRQPTHEIAARGLVRTFQGAAVFPEMTVAEALTVASYRRLRRDSGLLGSLGGVGDAERAEATLEEVCGRVPGLREVRALRCADLPHGTRRLVSVGMALCAEPHLLLLDEPLAGLEASEGRALLELCRELRAQGVALLLVEHNVGAVMDVCDRIVVLDFGRKIADGTPAEIRDDERVIEAYLGSATEEARV